MSLERLLEHRRTWQRKPVLREVYGVWFDTLLEGTHGQVVEVGAGPGLLLEHAARRRPDLRWLATDIIPAPWNHVCADATRLPVRSGSVDAVLGLDVVHHLARPLEFLSESARVLRTGGRVTLIEPWVTPLSYPIYRWLHREGCRLDLDPARPFAEGGDKAAFDGDAAVPLRLVQLQRAAWTELGLSPPEVEPINAFAYLLSLGFQPRSCLPRTLLPSLLRLDRLARPAARWLGLRARVSWRRL